MLPRNKLVSLLALVAALSLWLGAQTVSNSAPPAQQPAAQQPPAQQQPQGAQPSAQQPGAAQPTTPPADAPNQPGSTVQVPAGQQQSGQAPAGENNGVFIFKKDVQEVILHATVIDERHRLVNGLAKTDFQVFENGQPQQIKSFRREDIPVAVGIIIDNSGSMRDKRPAVNQAALNFVRASNPNDEVFIVNFNDEYYLDQDYTDKVPLLKDALERIESRGGTALYDAVVASSEHLKKQARLEKRVLLVVTDGEDNASRETLEQAIRRLQAENGPTVYTIGLMGEERQRRARRALQAMSEQTGGVSFFPKDLSEVDAITQEVAHDIRNQYTIGYAPTTPQSAGGYRTVKVEAKAPGYKHLLVRTRSGYYAGQERAARTN